MNITNHNLDNQKFNIINKLRTKVRESLETNEYRTAAFWSNKVISLTDNNKDDVYILAECFYHLKEYHRSSYLIEVNDLHKYDLKCRHLAAKCHFLANEFKEAFEILDLPIENNPLSNTIIDREKKNGSQNEEKRWLSSISLLKGHIFEAMDDRKSAVECFMQALQLNIYCYEAFHNLIQHQMLTIEEEEKLITSLNDSLTFEDNEKNLIKFLYESQLKKYAKPSELIVPIEYSSLQNNVDVMTSLAERLYYNCDYLQCFKITSQVLQKDIYHTQCLPIHISCLCELKKINLLFDLAHKLVELYPESPISWYAVGCYYLMINKTDAARRFLNKSTTLDNVFGPAWLQYGHSFAIENEHDQAMAAYFKASHLMKGCHLPLLYIGLEYGLTDNTKLAEKFFNQALIIAPDDPFVLHELGVIAYQNEDYSNAEKHFTNALNLIKDKKDITSLPEKWEPILNNMGHVLRKLKRYEEALTFHKQALVLSPHNPTSYSAIGYVYSLMRQWNLAVEYFHKALGLKRDDPVSTAMLGHSIEHLITELAPVGDELPIYESSECIDEFLSRCSNDEEKSNDKQNLTINSDSNINDMDTDMEISRE